MMSIPKFSKLARYFLGSVVIFVFNILCAALLSYDAVTREHLSILSMALIVFYALFPLLLCSIWYDWCYQKGKNGFSLRTLFKRTLFHIILWVGFCLVLFDGKFPIIAMFWSLLAVYLMQWMELGIRGHSMSLKNWSIAFLLGKKSMKNTYNPILVCLIATIIYSVNAYVFWTSSPFYIWWINNSVSKAVDNRIDSALKNEGKSHA